MLFSSNIQYNDKHVRMYTQVNMYMYVCIFMRTALLILVEPTH